jgi:HEAT repeat protein
LENRLNHRSVLTRLAAAIELGRRPNSNDRLIEILRKWCPAVRFAAANTLGIRRVKKAVPALLGVVFGRQDVAAAEALGRIGDRRALGPLLTMFECWRGHAFFPDPKFLEAVERAIVQFGDVAIGRLERLARKSPGLQDRVFCTLGHSSSRRAVQLLIKRLSENLEPIVDRLARMGDEARTELFRLAKDEIFPTRSRKIMARALSESPGAFQGEGTDISETLRRERDRTYLRTWIAVAITGDPKRKVENPVEALTALLRHPSCAKRRAAVNGLVELDAKTAAPEIAQLADDQRWEVRASVARALAGWGCPKEALERLQRDPDIIVRGWARGFK